MENSKLKEKIVQLLTDNEETVSGIMRILNSDDIGQCLFEVEKCDKDMFLKAIQVIGEENVASAQLLQRRLSITAEHSRRMLNELEKQGFVATLVTDMPKMVLSKTEDFLKTLRASALAELSAQGEDIYNKLYAETVRLIYKQREFINVSDLSKRLHIDYELTEELFERMRRDNIISSDFCPRLLLAAKDYL